MIGYDKEQFDRAANGLLTLLTHAEADYRLLGASSLANLNRETKAIDLALLNYFLHDSRVRVFFLLNIWEFSCLIGFGSNGMW